MRNSAEISKQQASTKTGQDKPFPQRNKNFQGTKILSANQIPGFFKIKNLKVFHWSGMQATAKYES